MGIELPDLKALHGVPMLYVMALGYILLLSALTFLTIKRSDSMDKQMADMGRLLESCIDRRTK